jgi:asparagine synthase (glutamine-hydrolysing)
VGVFLSGGIDSTILVIALKELGLTNIHSFTLGLPSDQAQERDLDLPYARLVAEQFGTVHQELHIRPPFNPTEVLLRVVGQFDDPILTPNCYTKHLLAGMARRAGIHCVLTGSGAGGGCGPYSRFRDLDLRQRMLKKSAGLQSDAARFLRLRGKLFGFDEIEELLPEGAALGPSDVERRLEPYLEPITTDEFPRAYLLANLLLTTPEKVCMALDGSGMLASVEIRSPHLDRQLVEFQTTVPSSFDGGQTYVGIKCLLKRAFGSQMPPAVLQRVEAGFPTYYWHRGELAELQAKLFSREALEQHGMFRPEALWRIVEQERHDTTSKSVGKRSWALTQVCLWHAHHVKPPAAYVHV